MKKRPLLYLACVFVAGSCFGAYGGWYFPAAAAALFFYRTAGTAEHKSLGRRLAGVLLASAAFLLPMLHMRGSLDFRKQELSQLRDNDAVIIQGEIYKKEYKNQQTTCYLKDVTAVLSQCTVSCNHVITYLDGEDFPIGETLLLQGKIHMWEPAVNEGGFDAEKFYASQKIDFALWDAEILKRNFKTNGFAEGLYRLRTRIFRVYQKAMKKEAAGVLSVMILGEKAALEETLKEQYRQSGISHMLAISGLHVSLVGMGLYRFLRKRGVRYVPAGFAALFFIFSYLVMSGNGVSARRAAGMLTLALAADVLGRSYDSLNALGLIAMLLLWENPFLLEYSGFWFSVTAVLGITVTGRIFAAQKTQGKLRTAFYASVGLWLTTLPLTAFCYYEIPVYAAGLNMVLLPLLSVLFLLGIWGGILGLCAFPLAKWLLLPCEWILEVYRLLSGISLKLPYAQRISGKPNLAKMLCYALLLLVFCFLLYYREQRLKRVRGGGLLRLGGSLFLVMFLLYAPKRGFELDVLDVGQGDGIYLCTEEGISLFIDGGSLDVKEVGKERILPFLKSKGIPSVSYWFVSHADQDHINGLKEVLEAGYPVRFLVIAETEREWGDAAVQELVSLAERCQTQVCTMKTGDKLSFGKSEICCLSPEKECVFAERNDRSLVLSYQDGQFRGIFSGDISSETEKLLAAYGRCKDADFYKAAHHGSNGSNSKEFLQAITPEIAVVSCGKDNSYGHPGKDAIKNMEDAGAAVYQTMEQGQIRIRKGKDGKPVVDFLKSDSLKS